MNRGEISIYNIAADVGAEVFKAKGVLRSVATYVEYHFQDEETPGNIQPIVNYHAGNIQVLLSLMSGMLCKAEEDIKELDKAMHDTTETGECA